jgi:hypothetical protein
LLPVAVCCRSCRSSSSSSLLPPPWCVLLLLLLLLFFAVASFLPELHLVAAAFLHHVSVVAQITTVACKLAPFAFCLISFILLHLAPMVIPSRLFFHFPPLLALFFFFSF